MSKPNQRSNFRIHLQIPLTALFKIIGIKNKKIDTKHSKIMIKDISAGGIRMHTPLDLPTEMSLLLEFTFLLFHQEMKILGVIKRKNDAETQPFMNTGLNSASQIRYWNNSLPVT